MQRLRVFYPRKCGCAEHDFDTQSSFSSFRSHYTDDDVDGEGGDEEEQEAWTVEMVRLPQDCNQGKGQGKIYVVPAGQVPTVETTACKTTALQCCGGEQGMFLSHGSGRLFLQRGNLGAGEMWVITPTANKGVFTNSCCGGAQVFFLNMVRASYT